MKVRRGGYGEIRGFSFKQVKVYVAYFEVTSKVRDGQKIDNLIMHCYWPDLARMSRFIGCKVYRGHVLTQTMLVASCNFSYSVSSLNTK